MLGTGYCVRGAATTWQGGACSPGPPAQTLLDVRPVLYTSRILRWREVINRLALVGDQRIEECHDEELKRSLRTVLLLDTTNVLASDNRPRLLDVHIIGMSPQAFTLSGFERIDGAEYMHSWIVGRCE